MKFDRRIVAAILLTAVFAPAVKADLITDPKEFNQFKKLTHGDKNNEKKSDKQKAKADKKARDKSSDKTTENKDPAKTESK